MTDRKAIKMLRSFLLITSMAEIEDEEEKEEIEETFQTAISALEEREARSEGCNICKEMDFVDIWDGDFLLKAGYSSFCPECGRPLKGADNG